MDWRRAFLRIGVILFFIPLLLGGFSNDYGDKSWPEEKVGYGLRLMYQQTQRLQAGMMASNDYQQSDEVLKRWLMKPHYRRFKAQEGLGYGALADSQVSVILKHSGSENELSSLGIRVKACIGDIATASIPLGSLPQIASLEQVSYIKLPALYRANGETGPVPVRNKALAPVRIKGQPQGLSSGKSIDAGRDFSPVRNKSASAAQLPANGAGVVVGYVDTGIDWDHPDFVNPDNTTRIKYLLDFSYPGDIDGDGILDGDEDYYGGTLYTEEQINTDLAGPGEVNETDLVGHGTHGASVACGDDSTYPGIAPTASLIVVKATRLDGSLLFFSDDIINAIAFIADKADLLGLPYVINLSLGTIVGPHDGSTLEEQAIDALVGDGREGRAVVISGGNSSDNRERPYEDFQRYHHASGQVHNGLTQSHDFTIPSYTPTEGSGNDGLAFDIWYQGKDELIIEVESPNGELVLASTGSIGYGSTPDGDILIANLSFPNLNNGDREARIYIDDESGNVPAEGVWTIRVTGKNITEGGAYDIWLFDGAMLGGESAYLSFNADNEALVAQPGTAYNGITVGAYATMREWIDVNTILREDVTAVLNDISAFSSPGLSRFGRMKPEIVSPGERVEGAVSQDAMPGTDYTIWDDHPFEEDNALMVSEWHGVLQGTSFSAPLVSGIVALLLDADPTLDAIDIRNILINSAEADTFTGMVPNEVWGFGKLNVSTTIINNPVMIETGSTPGFQLPDGVVGDEYSYQLAASGGSGSYSWTHIGGTLPSGLSLSSEGIISGTPDKVDIYNFTVQVSDGININTRELSIDIKANLPLRIVTTSLAKGQPDQPYSQTLQAEGGVEPYSWSILAGTLPPGLSLNSSSGEISGTPTTIGRSSFTINVQDALSINCAASFNIEVVIVGSEYGKWYHIGGGSGYVLSLAVDPVNNQNIYAGTNLGIYKSTDEGLSWEAPRLGDKIIYSIAIDNSNPLIIYAGTGSGIYRSMDEGVNWSPIFSEAGISSLSIFEDNTQIIYAGSNGSGVYRTDDGGNDWDQINNGLSDLFVHCVAVDPNNSNIIYAGTSYGYVFKSIDSGSNWGIVSQDMGAVNALAIDPSDSQIIFAGAFFGIYKSIDGGSNWSQNQSAIDTQDVAIDPSNSQVIYVATYWDGVFKSTDGGNSWSTSGLADTELQALEIDPLEPLVIYAGTLQDGLFKSINGAETWAVLNLDLTEISPCSLVINPENPEIIYMGTEGSGIFKSVNGGENWASINSNLGDCSWSGGFSSLAIDPTNANTIYAASWGDIFKSTTGGAYWDKIYDYLTTITSLAMHPSNPQIIYASTFYGGIFKSTDGGETFIYKGLDMCYIDCMIMDYDDPPILYAGSRYNGVYKSDDGGENWVEVNEGLTDTALMINSLAIHPQNHLVIYACTWDGLYKSENGGDSWIIIYDLFSDVLAISPSNPLTMYLATMTQVKKSINGGANWSNTTLDYGADVLAVDPSDSKIVYAANTYPGMIFKSTDGGDSWKQLENFSSLGNSITDVAADYLIDNVIYATSHGYGIYKSTDGGYSFFPINNGLGSCDINSIAVYPLNSDLLYAATQGEGIFKSTNGGASWTPTSQTTGVIEDIAVDDIGGGISRVWAAVKDEGIYISDDEGTIFTPSNDGLISRVWVKSIFKEAGISRVWVTTRGGDGIYLSEDDGVTWEPKCGVGLTNRNVNISRVWKNFDGSISRVWAGTDDGVFMSDDDGATWQHLDIGLPPNAEVTDIAFDPNSDEVFVTVDNPNTGGVYRTGQISRVWTAFSHGLTNLQVQGIAHDSGSTIIEDNPATKYFAGTSGAGLFGNTVVTEASSTLIIVTDLLPKAGLRYEYEQWLEASGGEPPYSWRLQSGSLPPGLNLSNSGMIRGVPSEEGLYSFIVEVVDSKLSINTKSMQIKVERGISPPHQVFSPDMPGGPWSGETYTYYTFTSSGSYCSFGHIVEYRFDWGDGTYSGWSSSPGASKFWFDTGTYTIKAQARCSVDHNIVSGWSPGKTVVINVEGELKEVVAGQGPGAASYVRDFCALNAALLKTWQAFGAANANGEVSVAKGDVTGDGIPEIVVGQRSMGASSYVRVFKKDGTLLWGFQAFGPGNVNGMVNVAVGDVDLDDVGEIVVAQGPGGNSYVRVFEYGNPTPVTTWRAFGGTNTSGEVRVAAGQTSPGSYDGQIITGQGHGGQSYVRVWDYGSPPALQSTFQTFGEGNASGGVDVGVGCFDGDPSGRDLIVVGQGGPGATAAGPAGSFIRIFNQSGTLLKTIKAFGNNNVNGRVTVSGGQADSDTAEEIIVGQAIGGASYWRVFNYNGSLIRTVKAFGAANTSGQVDIAGTRN